MKTKVIAAIMIMLFLASMTAIAAPVRAQPAVNIWVNMDPTEEPSPRGWCEMAYDSESDKMILFGGVPGYYLYNDETWAYDYNTNTWTNMNPSEKPSARCRYSLAYDSESDKMILFGGCGWGDILNDETWAYDYNTNTWTNMNPILKPSPRQEQVMVYDSESDRVILFGGTNYAWAGVYSDETWAYDYNTDTWTKMNPANSPSPRGASGMAYDSESDRVILFGGTVGGFPMDDETWAYDYNTDTWTNMNPTFSSPARTMHEMSYDCESDRVILFGGSVAPAWTWSDQTWAYDYNTNTWTNMDPAIKPSSRGNVPMAYDSESDKIVLFGGFPGWTSPYSNEWYYDDTWVYDLVYYSSPKESTQKLIENIKTLSLPKGTENSLTSKLQNAIQSLDNGQQNAAVNKLNAFINEVQAQRNKKLTNEQASTLITEAQRIINAIQG
jgi:hypothetical protein